MDVTLRRLSPLVIPFVLVGTSCSSAGHRKVAGPPPEYELPDDPAAPQPPPGAPRDAGAQ